MTVLDVVAVFPQASDAVNFLVCERLHPLLLTSPSLDDTLDAPHASVEVAVPKAALMFAAEGLQPNENEVPSAVTPGPVISFTVIVCEAVAVLPQ